MQIDRYFEVSDQQLIFTRRQSSDFAKQVAGDFNPLHDVDSRRFCVPGDLLFAIFLSRHGVFETMSFDFLAMVDASSPLIETRHDGRMLLNDDKDRHFLSVSLDGKHSQSLPLIKELTKAYVQFSGQTFPYLLVGLMKKNNVMINPVRPLVIYKSMELSLETLAIKDISLKFTEAALNRDGKKADVELNFDIYAADDVVGWGQKRMVLGGLRAFDEREMSILVEEYEEIKKQYVHGVA